MDISVYTLIAASRAAAPLMTEGGSIMTLSYYAAEKVVPNYNVMAIAKSGLESATRYLAWNLGPKNIRVNAISAGPIKTLAARGVGDLLDVGAHGCHGVERRRGRLLEHGSVPGIWKREGGIHVHEHELGRRDGGHGVDLGPELAQRPDEPSMLGHWQRRGFVDSGPRIEHGVAAARATARHP